MNLTAHGDAELCKRIGQLAINVPSRSGRTTSQCEQWLIHTFLTCLRSENCLQTPLKLEKRERPDFKLTLTRKLTDKYVLLFGLSCTETHSVGVECREVINQSEAKKLAYEEGEEEELTIELCCEDGYAGEFLEVEFVKAVSEAINHKHEKLIGGYERFERNLLLLYYNNFPPPLNKRAAISRMRDELVGYWRNQGFDAIIVYVDSIMVVFKENYSGIFHSPDPCGT